APCPVNELFIVVHGVGHQPELDTLRSFVEGSLRPHNASAGYSIAQLKESCDAHGGILTVRDLQVPLFEINYARAIEEHEKYAERDVTRWVNSFQFRLQEINRSRGGPATMSFEGLRFALDDIVLST